MSSTFMEVSMSKSLIPFNQMAHWKHGVEQDLASNAQDQKIDEYFECLIDCEDTDQSSCRRICTELLI